jgi:hypothetical protein
VDLRCNNGGIALNCGQEGIAIQAVTAPPRGPGQELFVYLPAAKKPVVAIGEVVWVDEFHHAGIRFTSMPVMARARFAEWLEQTSRKHPAGGQIMVSLPVVPARHESANTAATAAVQAASAIASPASASAPAEPFSSPQVANQLPAMDYSEAWVPAFAVAAVVTLALMLLCSPFLRRTTPVPSRPAQNRQPPASVQQPVHKAQPAVPNAPASAAPRVGGSATTSVQVPSSSPPNPESATNPSSTARPPRRVRRDDHDEVIVRHFTTPAPATAAHEQPALTPR